MKVLLMLSVVVAVVTPSTIYGGGVHHGGGGVSHGAGSSHGVAFSHGGGSVSHVGTSHGRAVVSVGSGVSHGSSIVTHGSPRSYHGGNVVSHGGGVEVLHAASSPVAVHSGAGVDQVDLSILYSDYHFSWLHDGGSKYTWDRAVYYCKSLGQGWQGISIETEAESKAANEVIAYHNLKYIWTGGFRQGYNWAWPSGSPFVGLNWSQTGAKGLPQPDNNDGNENCLAILNHFYPYDGITWHDVGCHHQKPIICERPRHSGGYRY